MEKTRFRAGRGLSQSRAMVRRGARHGGFTLIEILTVVVILGIVSLMVVPQIGTHADLNAAAAARVMMSDLMYAQNLSITTQKVHYIQFNATTQTYSIYDTTPLSTPINNPISNGPYTVTLGASAAAGLKDSQFQDVSFDGTTTLAFDELGSPYSYSSARPVGSQLVALAVGNVTVASGAVSMKITVQPYTGALSVSSN